MKVFMHQAKRKIKRLVKFITQKMSLVLHLGERILPSFIDRIYIVQSLCTSNTSDSVSHHRLIYLTALDQLSFQASFFTNATIWWLHKSGERIPFRDEIHALKRINVIRVRNAVFNSPEAHHFVPDEVGN